MKGDSLEREQQTEEEKRIMHTYVHSPLPIISIYCAALTIDIEQQQKQHAEMAG